MIVEKVFLNSEVPKLLECRARIAAATLGVSRSELVRRAITSYLKQLEPIAPRDHRVEVRDGDSKS